MNIDTYATVLRLSVGFIGLMIMVFIGYTIYDDFTSKKKLIELGKTVIPVIKEVRESFKDYLKTLTILKNEVLAYPILNYESYLKNDPNYTHLVNAGKVKEDAIIEVLANIDNPYFREKINLNEDLKNKKEYILSSLKRISYLTINKKAEKYLKKYSDALDSYFTDLITESHKEILRELYLKYYSSVDTRERNKVYKNDTEYKNIVDTVSSTIISTFDMMEDVYNGTY